MEPHEITVSRIYVTVILYIVLMYLCVSGHVPIFMNCDRWTWNDCVWCIGDAVTVTELWCNTAAYISICYIIIVKQW